MRAPSSLVLLFIVPIAVLAAACTPSLSTPIAEIPKLTTLAAVMANQATVADPQFSKMDTATYNDADYAAFAEVSERIQATSLKTKDFSKGPEFDGLATRLGEKAKALGTAAAAKDAKGSSTALKEMKATCKECHSKFK